MREFTAEELHGAYRTAPSRKGEATVDPWPHQKPTNKRVWQDLAAYINRRLQPPREQARGFWQGLVEWIYGARAGQNADVEPVTIVALEDIQPPLPPSPPVVVQAPKIELSGEELYGCLMPPMVGFWAQEEPHIKAYMEGVAKAVVELLERKAVQNSCETGGVHGAA